MTDMSHMTYECDGVVLEVEIDAVRRASGLLTDTSTGEPLGYPLGVRMRPVGKDAGHNGGRTFWKDGFRDAAGLVQDWPLGEPVPHFAFRQLEAQAAVLALLTERLPMVVVAVEAFIALEVPDGWTATVDPPEWTDDVDLWAIQLTNTGDAANLIDLFPWMDDDDDLHWGWSVTCPVDKPDGYMDPGATAQDALDYALTQVGPT